LRGGIHAARQFFPWPSRRDRQWQTAEDATPASRLIVLLTNGTFHILTLPQPTVSPWPKSFRQLVKGPPVRPAKIQDFNPDMMLESESEKIRFLSSAALTDRAARCRFSLLPFFQL
jgi:hypothetical protein